MNKLLPFNLINRSLTSIRRFYFPVFVVAAVLIFVAQKAETALPDYLNNYANDFFCLPIVLYLGQYCIRVIKSDKNLRLPLPLIICITIYYSVYFEYYLPNVNARYTGDLVDVALYFLGMLFFNTVEYGFKKK